MPNGWLHVFRKMPSRATAPHELPPRQDPRGSCRNSRACCIVDGSAPRVPLIGRCTTGSPTSEEAENER